MNEMSYKGKNKLFILMGLTILLIVQAILFTIFVPNQSFSIIMMTSIIIIIAIIAIFLSYISLKKINQRLVNLPEAYKKTYINANEMVGTSSMKPAQKKEVMNMILEIFEDANYANRSIEDVIDNDLESYMMGFIEASGGSYSPLYLMSYCAFLYMIYLLMIKIYKVLRPGNFTWDLLKSESLDVGIILVYAIIAFVFFPWILILINKAAKEQWRGIKRLIIVIPLIIPFGILGVLLKVNHPKFVAFIDQPIQLFSNIYSLGIGFILTLLFFLLMKFAQRKQYKSTL